MASYYQLSSVNTEIVARTHCKVAKTHCKVANQSGGALEKTLECFSDLTSLEDVCTCTFTEAVKM